VKKIDLISSLEEGKLDESISYINCSTEIKLEKERYKKLINKAYALFGDNDFRIFSAPGRTEVGGNHTDHQRGRVLAASVNMDIVAVCALDDNFVEFVSEGFKINKISVNDLEKKSEEYNSSESLIRGILYRFNKLGYNIGGFKCYSNSSVLKGSGISSSAAFEVLIGTILNGLYNDFSIDAIEIAQISQFAENVYFNKPSGLMDQMACSVGGFVAIDFKDLDCPKVEKVDFDFTHSGLNLVLVDTKGSHEDLSEEYGYMPLEMKEVAKFFGKEVMVDVTMEQLLLNMKEVREKINDRAVLRAMHFLNETDRVVEEVNALKANDIDTFLAKVIESGYSSYMYLQNVYSPTNQYQQNLSIALCVSEQLLRQKKAAYRVHGGGLAGTIQAFVPKDYLDQYVSMMNSIYGDDSCFVLSVRPVGGYEIKI
jgi:galactokinase